ncbi:MAG: hypothetical protein QM651_04890 [Rhodoblastus sp.]
MNGFETFASGLGASCLCAAPVLAMAAFDLDSSRPLRTILNGTAALLLAIAVGAAFV